MTFEKHVDWLSDEIFAEYLNTWIITKIFCSYSTDSAWPWDAEIHSRNYPRRSELPRDKHACFLDVDFTRKRETISFRRNPRPNRSIPVRVNSTDRSIRGFDGTLRDTSFLIMEKENDDTRFVKYVMLKKLFTFGYCKPPKEVVFHHIHFFVHYDASSSRECQTEKATAEFSLSLNKVAGGDSPEKEYFDTAFREWSKAVDGKKVRSIHMYWISYPKGSNVADSARSVWYNPWVASLSNGSKCRFLNFCKVRRLDWREIHRAGRIARKTRKEMERSVSTDDMTESGNNNMDSCHGCECVDKLPVGTDCPIFSVAHVLHLAVDTKPKNGFFTTVHVGTCSEDGRHRVLKVRSSGILLNITTL